MNSRILKTCCLALLGLLTSCLASDLSATRQEPTQAPTELSGKVALTDNTELDLTTLANKPLLLVFAQETCEVCIEETEAFKASHTQLVEKEIEIVTVLVGSILEDAVEWKADWEVPWRVGFDQNLKLYKALCPNSSTPCSLFQLPERGVVLKRVGLLHPEEILQILEAKEAIP